MYGITGKNVRQTVRTAKQSLVQPYRPLERLLNMTPEQETTIYDHIIQNDRKKEWLIEGQVLKWIEETIHCPRSYAGLARFLDGHADTVIRTTVTLQEDPRLLVPRAWLDVRMALITKMVPLTCCELIYNIDETGLSDWEDRGPKKAFAFAESFEEGCIMVWTAA
jgi:hypothetical protein